MESRSQNPDFRNNPEKIFSHACYVSSSSFNKNANSSFKTMVLYGTSANNAEHSEAILLITIHRSYSKVSMWIFDNLSYINIIVICFS